MMVSLAGTSSLRNTEHSNHSPAYGSLVQFVSATSLRTNVYRVPSCVPVVFFSAFDDEKMSKKGDPRRRIEVFERLQNHTHSNVFTPKAIYDGDSIAYASTVLSFGSAATVSRSEG